MDAIALLALGRAAQALSQADGDHAAETLVRAATEWSGAERGSIIVTTSDGFVIAAAVEPTARALEDVIDAETPDRFSHSAVSVAQASMQSVVVDDAAQNTHFTQDQYIRRWKPRSVCCVPMIHHDELIGFLYLEHRVAAGVFDGSRVVGLELLAAHGAALWACARLAERLRIERDERQRVEAGLAAVHEASIAVAESLDYDVTLSRIVHAVVPLMADWCIVDLVEDCGYRRAAVVHADAQKVGLLAELQDSYPPRPGSSQPAIRALERGESLLIPDLSDEEIDVSSHDARHAEVIRSLGTRSVLAIPLQARGKTLGAITFAAGTAGRFGRIEQALGEAFAERAALAMDNSSLYRSALRAIAARDEFLMVASHELHTPMTVLRLAVQSITAQLLPGAQEGVERMCVLLERQIQRQTRLVNELLNVARLDAGSHASFRDEVDLRQVIHDTLEMFSLELTRARCEVQLDLSGGLVGIWDPAQVEQILVNLLSNAIKFGPGAPIEIRAEVVGDVARLSVRDHGIGIAPDKLLSIFDRFQRGVSPRNYGGLGLGLYIVRRAVDAHGGRVWAESTPGAGVLVTVELPGALTERRA
ncbi:MULTISPECIES: sensor histidine kinase [Sandaracinus]|uniref:sensor histidine kinase n=1 Tax=Sandaracinus TaxID=1055688 RepID=UPI0019D413CF|nr:MULTISPECIES: ATP-binding protein [Sandaracinus]UJR87235.1 Multi-sensor signal transduction histidine kinase [Sandaracinus amylolyticus]